MTKKIRLVSKYNYSIVFFVGVFLLLELIHIFLLRNLNATVCIFGFEENIFFLNWRGFLCKVKEVYTHILKIQADFYSLF